ncbi:ATP/GTP-binding protein [Streptomyces goshikiensis]|uniref:ATP/GTP-binding protein n=1 Tax=Streptomyces goshikiensis TaxID=1942 RepID=UPI0016737FA1|nr:ATP/GTP-binding protein [Streptomyces goshikiensis]GHD79840.1 ATP/GTP-binding protein [Streptomyces goshikiensis]
MEADALTMSAAGTLGAVGDVLAALWAAGLWTWANLWWLAIIAAALAAGWQMLQQRLAAKALAERTCVELVPSGQFSPGDEEIWRHGMQLIRAAGSGPWWTPRRARTLRVRLRADGSRPLAYRIEAPASARALLHRSPFGPRVTVSRATPVADKKRTHVVRAVLTLRGKPGSKLREVPLEPDPLQPLVDAVAGIRADLGDLAEVCVDLSPAPRWQLALRRQQVVAQARTEARREAVREARWLGTQSTSSLPAAVGRLLDPATWKGTGRSPIVMPPRPRQVNRDRVLGKLAESAGLMRVQILVRCASDTEGRAEQLLALLNASMDVYAGVSRIGAQGVSIGPWRIGPDRWPWRPRFDARWATGLMRPAVGDWARIDELAGLLKPPTAAARVPVIEAQMPTYEPGKDLLPQGWYQGPDGRERLLATHEDDTLFEVQSGKAGWGKTMRAQVQAVASAHNGRGLAFVDPHGDSFTEVAPYLAHDEIMDRIHLFDLTIRDTNAMLACWNPLDMTGGQRPYEVTAAVVDAIAAALGWGDVTAPRALTILTKAVEALIAVNTSAVNTTASTGARTGARVGARTGARAGAGERQATLFQIRPLLTEPSFRQLVLRAMDDEARRWWATSFPDIPKDALLTVLNPLDRLAASPVIRAFLGCPLSGYDIRRAMDERHVVWICPPGTGPTGRLLVSLMVRDFLRAGLSRRDLPARDRSSFRFYLDELISLDGAASTVLAEITEQLRKFGCRLHGMTQLLHRLSGSTRTALLQNASCLSTTAGSADAIAQITGEWGGKVTVADAAELERWWHYASFTVAGKRIGPLLVRGPALAEVFRRLARPRRTGALLHAAHANTGARPLNELTTQALAQTETVRAFLTTLPTAAATAGGTDDTQEQYA